MEMFVNLKRGGNTSKILFVTAKKDSSFMVVANETQLRKVEFA